MTDCIVLQCPDCEKKRFCPAESTNMDKLYDRIAGHIVDYHPEKPPDEAESLIEHALENVDIVQVDTDPEELGGWQEELP